MTEAGDTEPRLPVRMCVRCGVTTVTPVVVTVVHQNSGPGFVVYACEACAAFYPAQPDVLTILPSSDQGGAEW